MKILHMLWLPFAYFFAPYWLANRALRGALKHYGVSMAVIPQELTREISTDTINTQKLYVRRPSVFKQLHDLQLLTDFNAITMRKVIKGEFKYEYEFTPEVEKIKNKTLSLYRHTQP